MDQLSNPELELRKEAEMLLSFQAGYGNNYSSLSIEELRRECAVQQMMLQLQQQKLDAANGAGEETINSFRPLQRIPVEREGTITETEKSQYRPRPLLYGDVVYNIQDGYIELDNNLCYTYVNRKIEEITGLEADYWLGKHIWDVFKDEIDSPTYQAIRKATSERVYTYSEDYYPRLGVWHQSHIYPTTNGLAIFVVDATERKNADLRLKETCQIAKLGGWTANLAEKKVYLSDVCCEILGLKYGEGLSVQQGLAFLNLGKGNTENEIIHQSICASIAKGEGFDEEIKVTLADGREKWVRIKARVEQGIQSKATLNGILQDITKIKAAQEKGYEQEKRFRVFMNNSPLAAWICDSAGYFDYVNKQYYTLFKPAGPVVGKNIKDFYPLEIAEQYIAENNLLLAQKETLTDVKHTLHQNGFEQNFLVNKFLLDDSSDNPKLGGIAVDITEQVKINNQLAEQQRFLKGITFNAPGLMSYWNKNLVCTFTNQTAKEWLGTELKDIVGQSMQHVLGDTLFANNYPYIQRALQGEKVQFERGGFNIHGAPGFIWIQYVPDIRDGVVEGFYSLVTDITELKKTQLAIEFEEKDKEALINSSNDFICSLDKDLNIITANKAYKDLLESVTGLPVKKGDSVKTGSGFDDETWALWNSFFERALAGESFTIETVTKPEGADWDLWTECAFTPIVQNGEITGLACYSRNITERKKQQDTIKNNEEKLKALLQNISDIIALVDENGIIKYVSPSVTQIMGYTENDVLGKNMFELVHPDDQGKAFEEMQKALQQPGYTTTLEIKLLHKNGNYIYLETRGTNQLHNPLIKALLINCRDITGRKKAEQDIKESYKKLEEYKFALDQSSMVFIMDDQGNYTYVNDNFCHLTKYNKEELIGNNRSLLASGYHNVEFYNNMWQALRLGKVWRAQVKGRAKDGSFFWFDATITPFLDSNGKPYQYLSINADITQTKLAEEALAMSNERFEYVTHATFDAIWDWDIVNKTIFWGSGYRTLFGYEPGLHNIQPNEGFSIHIHPDERNKVLTSIFDAIDEGKLYWSKDYRYKKANEEYAYVIDKAIIVRDEAGNAIRMIGAMQDITERKKAVQELERSELKFRSMVHNINDVITLVDDNGFVLYSSPSVKDVLGYQPKEVEGLKTFSILHPDDYVRSKTVFKNLLQIEGSGGVIEFRYKHKDGHYVIMESQGNNQLHNPAVKAVILTTRDITKRKEKEEERMLLVYELMEKNADLKQFSYITSHNLRAPLTNLMAICTLLDTETLSQDETNELINAFKISTAKLNETLNDLITILIIKDGRSQEVETVYFDKKLTEVKASISGLIASSEAVIHADFSAAESVPFYPIYMESIWLNLLTNAIKYAYPGRKPVIAIQTRDEEKFVVLTFMDNGMGMNMKRVKSKIFGLYQRFHGNVDGKGIGLYLVHSQVTALGGSITVDSREGEGTTFVIWFKKELFKRR